MLDNATAFVALVTLFFVGIGALGLPLVMPRLRGRALSVVGVVVVLGLVAMGLALVGARVPSVRRRLNTLLHSARRAMAECRRAASARPFDLARAAALHLLGKAWIVVEFWLVLSCFGIGATRTAALLGLASAAGSAVGSGIPGQLGAVESAVVGASTLSGIGMSTALAIALVRRVRSLLWILLGAASFPRNGKGAG